jgi:hypothetical protein
MMNPKVTPPTNPPVTPSKTPEYKPVELGVASEVTKGVIIGPLADFSNHRYVP